MHQISADRMAQPKALDRLPAKVNYYVGDDANKWRSGIPTTGRVAYNHIYPGIDVIYRGNGKNLRYDFVLAPGADPSQIQLQTPGFPWMSGYRLAPARPSAGGTTLLRHPIA